MYAMNIQNDIIGLVLRENCKSKQMTDFIAWPSRCHVRIQYKIVVVNYILCMPNGVVAVILFSADIGRFNSYIKLHFYEPFMYTFSWNVSIKTFQLYSSVHFLLLEVNHSTRITPETAESHWKIWSQSYRKLYWGIKFQRSLINARKIWRYQEVIRSRISKKDTSYNGQRKEMKKDNYIQKTTQTTKERYYLVSKKIFSTTQRYEQNGFHFQ
jgi:hypothetical protein